MPLYGALGEVVRTGKLVHCGVATLDGANPTPLTTPFANVDAVLLQLEGSTAPGLGASVLTYEVDGSTVNVYAWEPTASGDATLTASDSEVDFSYLIIGRRRQ